MIRVLIVLVVSITCLSANPLGEWSNPDRLKVLGANTFGNKKVHEAIIRSSQYVLSSHPGADLKSYIIGLEKILSSSLPENGFPNAKYEVKVNIPDDVIELHIKEGDFFLNEEIVVKGFDENIKKRMIYLLTTDDDIKNQLGMKMKHLPPKWEKSKPTNFSDFYLDKVEKFAVELNRESGYFFSKVKVAYVDGVKGKKKLVIELLEPGLVGFLKGMKFSGLKFHTEDELNEYLKFAIDIPLDFQLYDKLRKKLYESGRFVSIKDEPIVIDKTKKHIGVSFEIKEMPFVPKLNEAIPEKAEKLMKMQHIYGALARDEVDFNVSFIYKKELGGGNVYLSNSKGLIIELERLFKESKPLKSVFMTMGKDIKLISEEKKEVRSNKHFDTSLIFKLRHDLPKNINDRKSKGSLNFNLGFQSKMDGAIKMETGCHPAALLRDIMFNLKDIEILKDKVVFNSKTFIYHFYHEKHVEVELKNEKGKNFGKVTLKENLFPKDSTFSETIKGYKSISEKNESIWSFYVAMAEELGGILRHDVELEEVSRLYDKNILAFSMLMHSGLSELANDTEEKDELDFKIPVDRSINPYAIMASAGFDYVAEYVPYESWPFKLSREIVFVAAGKTKNTTHSVRELYQSKTMGPSGFMASSYLLRFINPYFSKLFAERGLQMLDEKHFDKDIQLAIDIVNHNPKLKEKLALALKGTEAFKSLVKDIIKIEGKENQANVNTLKFLEELTDDTDESLRKVGKFLWKAKFKDELSKTLTEMKK